MNVFFFCRLLIFFQDKFFRKILIRLSNTLDANQGQQNVGPDLGMNSFQRLLADDKSRERVKPHAKIRPINPLGSCAYMFKESLNVHMGKVPKSLQLAGLCIYTVLSLYNTLLYNTFFDITQSCLAPIFFHGILQRNYRKMTMENCSLYVIHL